MSAITWHILIVLILSVGSTIAMGVYLLRMSKTAPDRATKSGVKGYALVVKYGTPALLLLLIVSFFGIIARSSSAIWLTLMVAVAFNFLFAGVAKYQVAAERSKISTGRSTWRGRRALKWGWQSAFALAFTYTLLLGLLLCVSITQR